MAAIYLFLLGISPPCSPRRPLAILLGHVCMQPTAEVVLSARCWVEENRFVAAIELALTVAWDFLLTAARGSSHGSRDIV